MNKDDIRKLSSDILFEIINEIVDRAKNGDHLAIDFMIDRIKSSQKISVSRKKKKRSFTRNLSEAERKKKRLDILDAFDSGQFSTLGEMAVYASVQNETVTRILQKERADQFKIFKNKHAVGRKPKQ